MNEEPQGECPACGVLSAVERKQRVSLEVAAGEPTQPKFYAMKTHDDPPDSGLPCSGIGSEPTKLVFGKQAA